MRVRVKIVGRPGKAHTALGKGIVRQQSMLNQHLQGRDFAQFTGARREDGLLTLDLGQRLTVGLGVERLLLIVQPLARIAQELALTVELLRRLLNARA